MATHQGQLAIGGDELECVVLEDGRRVISQASIMAALGRSTSSGRRSRNDNRPPFLEANNLTPFVTDELRDLMRRIDYRVGGTRGIKSGYDAQILPLVCGVYIDADDEGMSTPNQKSAVMAARRIVRALARVGITALVDEATGYQETRARDELQRLLDAYIAEEFRPWVKRFPDAFFKALYRLHGWEFVPGNHQHPSYTGKFINKYVYEAMPEGILERLKEINPSNESGNRARKHHQHLTDDQGVVHLDRQIHQVLTLMQISSDKAEFELLFKRAVDATSPSQTIMQLDY